MQMRVRPSALAAKVSDSDLPVRVELRGARSGHPFGRLRAQRSIELSHYEDLDNDVVADRSEHTRQERLLFPRQGSNPRESSSRFKRRQPRVRAWSDLCP